MELDAATLEAAGFLQASGGVRVVAHIDADGLCSAAVASRALGTAGIDHEVRFVKSLSADEVKTAQAEGWPALWFVDLGSGQAPLLQHVPCVITDHHAPKEPGPRHHINAHFLGLDGSREVSGAGTTWLVARHLAPDAAGPLAALAVLGAVGDLQNREARQLTGLNRAILGQAVEAGVVAPVRDVLWFGRETRPLSRFLEYAEDPAIPGVSGSPAGVAAFLGHVGLARDGDARRSWVLLDHEGRRRTVNEAVRRMLAAGLSAGAIARLFGEVYEFPADPPGTPTHEAKEFATLLNSTARYGREDVGLALAMGDRGAALAAATDLLRGHRKHLVESVNLVRELGIKDHGRLQWFHGGDRIRDTVVGVVAGMLFKDGAGGADRVIVGFANADATSVKASVRATRPMAARGLDLSVAVSLAAGKVGGEGGGHRVAAGATIPAGSEERFLDALDTALSHQLAAGVP